MKEETWENIVDTIFSFPPIRKFDEITSPHWEYKRGWSGEHGGSWFTQARFKLGRHWHLTITRTALTHKEIKEKKGE